MVCKAQSPQGPLTTTYPPIDQFQPFDSFQYDDGTGNDYWWNVGGATLPNGHMTSVYQDDNGGTSTAEYDPVGGTLVTWTITLGNGGGTLTYVDGAPAGHLGCFVQQSGAPALNKVIGINTVDYAAQSGNLLVPTTSTSNPSGESPNYLWSITYNGVTSTRINDTYDYLWRTVSHFTNGVTIISSTADLEQYAEQKAIGFSADHSVAKYIGSDGMNYSYRPSSTAANLLTKINGYTLGATGTTVSLPKPVVSSFVWNGDLYTFDIVFWMDYGQYTNPRYGLCDGYTSSTAQYPPGMTPYIGNDYIWASVNPDGSLGSIELSGYNGESNLAGGPVNFSQSGVIGPSVFTFINNHPYTTIGTPSYNGPSVPVVPVPPVTTFVYNGNTYQYMSTASGANNTLVTQYTASGGGTAIMNWSQATNQLVNLQVRPSDTSGMAMYVNGDAVGQPGAYILSSSSTLLNRLTQVNTTSLSLDGNTALPSSGFTDSGGVFDIHGDFMNLGSWLHDPSHVGFTLAYYDGESSSLPASVEFTASRPWNSWWWSVSSADGTRSNPVIQVDETNRWMLYPQADPGATGPSLPTPSVVLDPNGTSSYRHPVRFDGPVRISKQGDLEMGEFTSDPTPTPAQ